MNYRIEYYIYKSDKEFRILYYFLADNLEELINNKFYQFLLEQYGKIPEFKIHQILKLYYKDKFLVLETINKEKYEKYLKSIFEYRRN